ncbi:glycosyltransferase [Flavobacteriaceae bacterium 14752]|uniref:glycosyltransferase n=1 Tax=Mesohalobacter salilacus TaxID=2491711 RepID=UPI000F631F73|nr:glycosyltransferase [Flavobacteriaceae bacterium 14752]
MFTPLELIWILLIFLYFSFDIILLLAVNKIKLKPFNNSSPSPISVVIAAKNEAENLKTNLPYILKQNYPLFEVIVVDDQSKDKTLEILKQFEERYQFLKCLSVKSSLKSSKKNALDLGIHHAKYEHLVFTDADCKPISENWLMHLQNHFSPQHELVLGFSPYRKLPNPINPIIRFETLLTAINYFGFSKIGMPYMGVGRNLAYTKSLYRKIGGFKTHRHLLSGDDDLLVNQAVKKTQIALCLNPDSFVESQPKLDFKSWVNQKRRHVTTASYYRLKHKLWLGLQYISKVLFWFIAIPLSVVLEIQNNFQLQFVSNILFLLILKSFLSFNIYKIFLSKDLWFWSYYLEIKLICLQFYIFTKNLFSPKSTW